jgi:outer membrane protein
MNKRKFLIINLLALTAIVFSPILHGQETDTWTLREAIDYARENNIQVQSQQISKNQSELGLEQARAALFPTLSFSSNQSMGFSNASSYNEFNEATGSSTYNGSYSLSSGVTLFAGGKLRNNIKQKEIQDQASGYNVEQAKTDIEVSVTQAYLQILYSYESLKIAEQAAELSRAQTERAVQMYAAGSISKADLASLQAQAANDEYQIISSQTSLSSAKLQLKQLLELGMTENFEVDFPEINDDQVLASIPSLETVYNTALSELPQMKSSALSIEAADIAVEIAKAAQLPTVSMNAGVSTSSTTASPDVLFDQLSNKINENVGVSINVPILNGKQAKTNVNNAKQQSLSARLQDQSAKKNLLSTIESLYNDAFSAQSKYVSANEKLNAAKISYEIVTEQFNSGLKNTVELITERNNYLNAQGNQLQAKFQAVLALKLLNVYQNQPVTL